MASQLNTLPVQPQLRQPRGLLSINGALVPWREFSVVNKNYRAADTFHAVLPISTLPDTMGLDWWAAQTSDILIDLYAGFPTDPLNYGKSDLLQLLHGKIDEINIDPVKRTVELTGRDLTALLIDTKTTEKWVTKTSSDIATILAGRHGLTPVVTTTSTQVGAYYSRETVTLTDQRTEWDLLCFLAQQEGFIVYVKNTELHFEPYVQSSDPYVIQWDGSGSVPQANATDLKFSRNMSVAKGVIVQVSCAHGKQGRSFTVSFPKRPKGTAVGGSTSPLVYHYVLNNRSQQQCEEYAQARYKDITSHEMRLEASLPGNDELFGNSIIQVKGISAGWDQTYYPESVTRTLSVTSGYRMTVSAKNQAPDSASVS